MSYLIVTAVALACGFMCGWMYRDVQASKPAEHVHGAWCHPSADGCPERPGM